MTRRLFLALVAAAIVTASLVAPSQAGPVGPTAPDGPAVVRAAFGCDSDVTISWDPPGFDGGSPVTGYTVYADDSMLAEVGADTLTYGPTEAGPDFSVSASNEIGESQPTPVTQATTPGCIRPPAAPVLTADGCLGGYQLTWEPELNATSYRLYKDGQLVAEPPADVTTYIVATASATDTPGEGTSVGRPLVYTVSAVNPAGESPLSNAVEIGPCPAGPPGPNPPRPIPRQPNFTG